MCPVIIGLEELAWERCTPLFLINLLFPCILLLVTIVLLSNLTKSFYSLNCSFMDGDGPSPPQAQTSLVPFWDFGTKSLMKGAFFPLGILQQGPASSASPNGGVYPDFLGACQPCSLGLGSVTTQSRCHSRFGTANPSQNPLPASFQLSHSSSPPLSPHNSFLY